MCALLRCGRRKPHRSASVYYRRPQPSDLLLANVTILSCCGARLIDPSLDRIHRLLAMLGGEESVIIFSDLLQLCPYLLGKQLRLRDGGICEVQEPCGVRLSLLFCSSCFFL